MAKKKFRDDEPIHEGDYLSIDKHSLTELQALHQKAIEEGKTQFTFQGKDILTAYGGYLLEYLKTQNI